MFVLTPHFVQDENLTLWGSRSLDEKILQLITIFTCLLYFHFYDQPWPRTRNFSVTALISVFSCSHFYLPQSTPLISGSKFQIAAARSTMLLIGVKKGKPKKDLLYFSDRPDQDDVQRYSRSILQSLSFLCMWDDPPTIPIPIPIPNHSYFPGTPSTFLLLT